MLRYPLKMTWAEVAALPGAAEAFSWDLSMSDDDDPDLVSYIANYSVAYKNSPDLNTQLEMVGYMTDFIDGIEIADRAAVSYASELFYQVVMEYDHIGEESMPTWERFGLKSDGDVDFCGGQPSCLTDLLLSHMKDDSHAQDS